jgi:uncharacterized protein YcbK (DUF882 family)
MDLQRRKILTLASATTLSAVLATPAWAQNMPQVANDFWLRPRTLRLKHLQGDKIEALYWRDGEIQWQAYQELSWFMRDRYARRQYNPAIDVRLLDATLSGGRKSRERHSTRSIIMVAQTM